MLTLLGRTAGGRRGSIKEGLREAQPFGEDLDGGLVSG